VLFAADYPFLDVLWTMLIFFAWVIWFWILITIFADLFRRDDASGWKKAIWIVFLIVTPFLANHEGMNQRNLRQARASQEQFKDYVQSVSGGGAAAEIEKAKGLLDSGAISQAEYDQIKAKALAG
jgi:hypothetical protein